MSRRSRHVTFKLPTEELEAKLNDVVVQVKKVSADVKKLKQSIALESAARNDLQMCVDDLKAENAEFKKNLTDVPKNQSDEMANALHLFMTTMPCKSLPELNLLVKHIENRLHFMQWTEYIKLIGGNDFNTAIKKIFQNTLAKCVQKQLSWAGIRTNKPSIKTEYKIFLDAIHVTMKEKFKDYTIAQGEEKTKTLLRNAASCSN